MDQVCLEGVETDFDSHRYQSSDGRSCHGRRVSFTAKETSYGLSRRSMGIANIGQSRHLLNGQLRPRLASRNRRDPERRSAAELIAKLWLIGRYEFGIEGHEAKEKFACVSVTTETRTARVGQLQH